MVYREVLIALSCFEDMVKMSEESGLSSKEDQGKYMEKFQGENVITTGSDHRLLRSVILFDAKKERRVLHSQKTLVRQTFNADMYAAMIESSDLHMNMGSSIDADYEDLVGKITQAVKASSIAIEPARRRRISTEALQMMKK
ncbi:hypothetical protein OSTOST_05261 [Ostertagia ostertagi]